MFDRLNNFQNRSPGGVAVIAVPLNRTVDKLHLRLPSGVTKSQILRIEGKINDRTFFVDDGTRATVRDTYLSNIAGFIDPQVITLDFTEPHARGGAPEQFLTSLPANLMKKLNFEITLDSGLTNAQAAAIVCDHEYRGPTGNPFVMRRKDNTAPLSFVGENDILLPSGATGGLIKRIWIHHGGNVTGAELRGDNTTKFRWIDLSAMAYAQKRNGFTPQTNVAVIDFVAEGNMMSAFNTKAYAESLLRLTTTAVDAARIYVDFVDHINLI